MPANTRRAEGESDPAVVPLRGQSDALPDKPKFVVAEGRGGSGKTTGIRYIVERAQLAGREVAVIDLDPRLQLREYFERVSSPQYSDEVVVHDFLDALVNAQAEADPPPTLLLDQNGNDPVFGRFAASVGLMELLPSVGVQPVRLRFLGPDAEDLADLARDDAAGAFCPEATVLFLNHGAIRDGRRAEIAFAATRQHPVFRAAVDRGARVVDLPRLDCMAAVAASGLQFAAAEAHGPLGVTNRQRVKIWRRAMEDVLAPVAAWLP